MRRPRGEGEGDVDVDMLLSLTGASPHTSGYRIYQRDPQNMHKAADGVAGCCRTAGRYIIMRLSTASSWAVLGFGPEREVFGCWCSWVVCLSGVGSSIIYCCARSASECHESVPRQDLGGET